MTSRAATTKTKAAPKKGNGKENGNGKVIQLKGGSTVTQGALNQALREAFNSGARQAVQAKTKPQQKAIVPAPLGAMFDGFHPGNALSTRPRMRYDKSLHVPMIGFENFSVPAGSVALVVFTPPQYSMTETFAEYPGVTLPNYQVTEGHGRKMICPLTALIYIMTQTEKAAMLAGTVADGGLEAAYAITLTTLGTCGASDLSIDRLSMSLRNTTPAVERGGSIKSLRANGPLALELADTQPTTVQPSMLSPDFGYMVSKKSIAATMQGVAEHPLRSMYHGDDLGSAHKINARPLDPVECDQFYPLSSTSSGNVPVFMITDGLDNDQAHLWPGDVRGYTGCLIRNIGAFRNPFHAGAAQGTWAESRWKRQAYNYGDPAWTPVCIVIEAGTKDQTYEVTCKGGLSAHFAQTSFLAPMQKPRKIVTSDQAAGANAAEGSKESTMAPVSNSKTVPAKVWDFVSADNSDWDPREMAGKAALGWMQNNPSAAKNLAISGGNALLRANGIPFKF
jgi:hypothetical protein